MGKNLKHGNLVTRPQKLAFYQLPNGSYQRMEGFTDLSYSQNPKEYSRQYVDEEFERTDIVGYAPSISYAFDRYTGNDVLRDLVEISENEFIGDMMKRTIVTVDLTKGSSSYGNAKKRDFAVIPDGNGDSTDCLTYSGNFKAKSELTDCVATSGDDWQTIRVTENIEKSASATVTILGDALREPLTDGGATHLTSEISKNMPFTFRVMADFAGAEISLYSVTNNYSYKITKETGILEYNILNGINIDSNYEILVEAGGRQTLFEIELTVVD